MSTATSNKLGGLFIVLVLSPASTIKKNASGFISWMEYFLKEKKKLTILIFTV